ncbi:MAG: hypothetical protein IJZ35_02190 [Clostridia bacterium]|nr:hypothetical protein [Clostridia bacterium]
MKISLKGYGENTATFKINSAITGGEPVCMEDNLTVKSCEAGDAFIGCAVNSKDGYACVQLDGYATFTYSGTAPEVGICNLAADGNGGVCVSESGRQFIVTDVDTVSSTAGIIL